MTSPAVQALALQIANLQARAKARDECRYLAWMYCVERFNGPLDSCTFTDGPCDVCWSMAAALIREADEIRGREYGDD